MKSPFSFRFEGKERRAEVYISLQNDYCFIFTVIKDEEIITRFGADIDFELDRDGYFVKEVGVQNPDLLKLRNAILDAARGLSEFEKQQCKLIVKAGEFIPAFYAANY